MDWENQYSGEQANVAALQLLAEIKKMKEVDKEEELTEMVENLNLDDFKPKFIKAKDRKEINGLKSDFQKKMRIGKKDDQIDY